MVNISNETSSESSIMQRLHKSHILTYSMHMVNGLLVTLGIALCVVCFTMSNVKTFNNFPGREGVQEVLMGLRMYNCSLVGVCLAVFAMVSALVSGVFVRQRVCTLLQRCVALLLALGQGAVFAVSVGRVVIVQAWIDYGINQSKYNDLADGTEALAALGLSLAVLLVLLTGTDLALTVTEQPKTQACRELIAEANDHQVLPSDDTVESKEEVSEKMDSATAVDTSFEV